MLLRFILTLVLMCFSVLSLSACKTTVKDGPTKITIEDGNHHGNNGTFCPPGQAKKGNCYI